MQQYRLTTKGKIVIVVLCTFIVLFISVGISFNMRNVPQYYDYSKPNTDTQQEAVIPEPPPPSPPPELEKGKDEKLEELRVAVFFEANMTSFDAQYKKALDIFSAAALQHDDIKIQVEGNCATLFPQNKKQKSVNYNLSLLRAQVIADYLKSKGIHSDRIVILGNGSDKPLKDNKSPEGRRFNRRVDIFFVNKK